MFQFRTLISVISAAALGAACATTAPPPTGTVEMRLLPGQSPVAEIDGPYAAYSRVGHGVVLRVWPDSIADGAVDISIIVRNTELEAIRFSAVDVVATGETGPVGINGEVEMLARFDAGPLRRNRSQGALMSQATFSGGSVYDGNATDGAIKVQAPASPYSISGGRDAASDDEASQQDRQAQREQVADWYLGSMEIGAGETAVGGISLTLPESSQTIIINVDLDSEDHEFALVFERGQ